MEMIVMERPERILDVSSIMMELFPTLNEVYCFKFLSRWYHKDYKLEDMQEIVYHDHNHIFAVVINANKIAIQMNLPKEERQILFIAALFHDYGHSYGRETDTYNITNAISELYAMQTSYAWLLDVPHHIIDAAADAILCTIYPFRIRPKTTVECILRDADLTMSLEPDAEVFAEGLQNEIRRKHPDVVITKETMAQFAKEQRFYTIECAQLFGFNYAYRFKTDKLKTKE